MSHISVADAIVALRSFPRRYRELIAPPGGNLSDRLVRIIAPGQTRSALGWTAEAAHLLSAIGAALAALPSHSTVTLNRHGFGDSSEVAMSTGVDAVLHELTTAATMAAVAAEARPTIDWDREIILDGVPTRAAEVLAELVEAVATHLKDLTQALKAAQPH